ncbi:hemin uptake protein HemP [Pseudoxanthomonas composti]|uniref:Hemin uptake protein HemP n=1 Tax=Pseudoxanthomonas composti TaxID=2137479 RepID=A0A4Q1JZF4_9GAMM|nr:hemin uptake protein HemP [Pseudoxanthomonas composti]RXR08715.1 hemin uptake protein HemP [Pseudoxanthomonas composti]
MSANTLAFPQINRSTPVQPVVPSSGEVVVSSDALLKGRREILIQHGDRFYRLRHTSNDKLILTK